MPILICILPFLVMYFLLRNDNKEINRQQTEHVNCNQCGESVDISYDCCPHCDAKLKEECGHCKKMISTNWRYCPYCGITKEKHYTIKN